MKLPIYLFAGFLDSGKSTLLRTKVEQGDIPTDGPSLLLLCENGQTSFSPDWCARYQITPLRFKTPAELTAAAVGAALQKQPYQRVLVEYNGMWDFSLLFRVFSAPDQDVSLFAVAKYACCHSALFPSYAKNLSDLTLGQLRSCDQVFLNWMPPNTDPKPLYDLVRKYTGRAEIHYQYTDGTEQVDDTDYGTLYLMDADPIRIPDAAFAFFRYDLNLHPTRYDGKTVQLRGKVQLDGPSSFQLGRTILRYSIHDAAYQGLLCRTGSLPMPEADQWITVTAVLRLDVEQPVLDVTAWEPTSPVLRDLTAFL